MAAPQNYLAVIKVVGIGCAGIALAINQWAGLTADKPVTFTRQ